MKGCKQKILSQNRQKIGVEGNKELAISICLRFSIANDKNKVQMCLFFHIFKWSGAGNRA